VKAFAPGVTRTGMTCVSDDLLADVPLRGSPNPRRSRTRCSWLAASTYTTGTVLTVDGGYTDR
jgi:hypothetical protein